MYKLNLLYKVLLDATGTTKKIFLYLGNIHKRIDNIWRLEM